MIFEKRSTHTEPFRVLLEEIRSVEKKANRNEEQNLYTRELCNYVQDGHGWIQPCFVTLLFICSRFCHFDAARHS
jgi:hypothetical protein